MLLWLRTVNAALYLAACSLVATGLEWKVEIDDESRTLLGMAGEDWGELHFLLALVVMGLVVVHLATAWGQSPTMTDTTDRSVMGCRSDNPRHLQDRHPTTLLEAFKPTK